MNNFGQRVRKLVKDRARGGRSLTNREELGLKSFLDFSETYAFKEEHLPFKHFILKLLERRADLSFDISLDIEEFFRGKVVINFFNHDSEDLQVKSDVSLYLFTDIFLFKVNGMSSEVLVLSITNDIDLLELILLY